MANPTDEVPPDIQAAQNPMEIRNDGGGCAVCGKWDCKKPNHTPPARSEQCGQAKFDWSFSWWWGKD